LAELSKSEMQEEPHIALTISPATRRQRPRCMLQKAIPQNGSTRASSRLWNRAVANRRTFGSSLNKLASSAAASPRIPTTSDSRSHVRLAVRSAMSSSVTLCRGHHRAVHRSLDERGWWRQAGIDPIGVARSLWKETLGMGTRPPDPDRMSCRILGPRARDISADAADAERQEKNLSQDLSC
jgi:hypothetical protein